ncbi:unnamed protein product [Paramecium primaurelia]|uniref:Uncharacterized protein n=1 Tax=Paramecium primaurelia TaxID=5886 RepID=A0A8S1MT52_PARPR|nr:unnamed protein product [Paramecium primaurelia]
MNLKTSRDCCVQTELDLMEIELFENIYSKMISSKLLSGSIISKNQYQKIDQRNNLYSFQLRKVDTIEQNLNKQREKKQIYKNNKQIYNEYDSKFIRKKQLIPKSFHIETLNNIATPQQIILPQKQLFTLHGLKRILYKNLIPEKIKHFDGIKTLK